MPSTAHLKIAPARACAAPEERMKALSQDVMNEVVAGLLWVHLEIPEDASRNELQECAQKVAQRVHAGASEAAIANFIRILQLEQFGELPNLPQIRVLARHIVMVIRPASASLRSAA